MMAKFYDVGQPITKEELDQLTGDFDVICSVRPDVKHDTDTATVYS